MRDCSSLADSSCSGCSSSSAARELTEESAIAARGARGERPAPLQCTERHAARRARPRAAGLLRCGHAAEAEDAHKEDAVDGGEAGGNVLPDHGEA
eukprot:scaffold57506_cov62-Phaeocystis_antarctica.AAC.8